MEQKNENLEIKDMIYTIRGKQVMLDFDLSSLLDYELKQLNRQIKRHASDFNEEVLFKLTKEELELVQRQNGTAPTNLMAGNTGGRRTLPYVLTMQAIEVLGTFLRKNNAQKTIKELLQAFSNESSNSMLIVSKSTDDIKSLIYMIRGEQVMFDFDLAVIYGYEVKSLNQQVKRNLSRFPKDFMFQLSREECAKYCPKSQIVTLNENENKRGTNIKKRPYAFTEQGIYMLSTVLNGELAVTQSINIMRTFKEMRHFLTENKQLIDVNSVIQLSLKVGNLSDKVNKHDERIQEHAEKLRNAEASINETNLKMDTIMHNFIDDTKIKEFTFVDNQKFEADMAYYEIYKRAKSSLIVIDDYISIKTLKQMNELDKSISIILISDNKSKNRLQAFELEDFKLNHPSCKILKSNGKVHDRYIALDFETPTEQIYHCGTSSKDAGNKLCTIMRMNDTYMIHIAVSILLTNEDLELK